VRNIRRRVRSGPTRPVRAPSSWYSEEQIPPEVEPDLLDTSFDESAIVFATDIWFKEKSMQRLVLILVGILFLLSMGSAAFAQEKPAMPPGWGRTGSNPSGYDFVIDTNSKHSGKSSILIRAKPTAVAEKFGSLVQAIRPDDFSGKRIRFSGYVKTENIGGYVQLWVRVDGKNLNMLDFSNMDDKAIKGSGDWKKYDLVVDVPADAAAIVFGAFVGGATGQAWIDDLKLETVSSNTPKTSNVISEADRREQEEYLKQTPKEEIDKTIASYRALPTKAVNLDFEQVAAKPNVPAQKP